MTRFLVRCASVAISTSVLAVGAGRADARDSNEGRDAESKNMKLVGFNGPIRSDHGRMIWGESGQPGYGLYDRALGAMYLHGLWEGVGGN